MRSVAQLTGTPDGNEISWRNWSLILLAILIFGYAISGNATWALLHGIVDVRNNSAVITKLKQDLSYERLENDQLTEDNKELRKRMEEQLNTFRDLDMCKTQECKVDAFIKDNP